MKVGKGAKNAPVANPWCSWWRMKKRGMMACLSHNLNPHFYIPEQIYYNTLFSFVSFSRACSIDRGNPFCANRFYALGVAQLSHQLHVVPPRRIGTDMSGNGSVPRPVALSNEITKHAA